MNNSPDVSGERQGVFEFSKLGKMLILAWGLGFVPLGAGLAIHGAYAFRFSEHSVANIIEIFVGTGLIFGPVILGLLSLRHERVTTMSIDPQLPQPRE